MGKNSMKKTFLFCLKCKKKLGQSPPQELEEGLCSGPYLLALNNDREEHSVDDNPQSVSLQQCYHCTFILNLSQQP